MIFPVRLKYLRKSKKRSQQNMGDYIGVTRQAYAKYENGESEPDHKTMIKLANYFNVTVDYLMGYTDNPNLTVKEEGKTKGISEKISKRLEGLPEEEQRRILNKVLAYVDVETNASKEE